jgi:hypothetical protein
LIVAGRFVSRSVQREALAMDRMASAWTASEGRPMAVYRSAIKPE